MVLVTGMLVFVFHYCLLDCAAVRWIVGGGVHYLCFWVLGFIIARLFVCLLACSPGLVFIGSSGFNALLCFRVWVLHLV